MRDRTASFPIDRPDPSPPEYGKHLVGWFWGLRRFLGGHENAITPGIVREWSGWSGVSLSRREEGIIYAMDAAFRRKMPELIEHDRKRREAQKKQGLE